MATALTFPIFQPLPPAPTAPTGFHVTGVTDSTISLAWTPGVNQVSYDVTLDHFRTSGQSDETFPGDATSGVLTNLYPGTMYCVFLKAVNRNTIATAPTRLCVTSRDLYTVRPACAALPAWSSFSPRLNQHHLTRTL